MENYEVIIFIAKYIICLVLLYYTIKSKKTELLYKAIIGTFATFSIVIILNLLLTYLKNIESKVPFYYINFIDFISIALIVNLFLYKKKP